MEKDLQTTHEAIFTAIQGIQEAISGIQDGMRKHFIDDKESFSKIDARQSKFEEINKQNGEHFSHFNKLLLEIKEEQVLIKNTLAPIEKDRADDVVIDQRNQRVANQILLLAKVIGGISAMCVTIWAVIKYIILQAIK